MYCTSIPLTGFQTILLIGAGVSSTDIGRETSGIAKKVYQSSRGGPFDIPVTMLAPDTERVAGISAFLPPVDHKNTRSVVLTDGTTLTGIDRVVIATGYHFTLPFLVDLHDDSATPETASDTILVTDGTQLHNLHKDIFYIPDPSLAFVGIPFYTATYTFFEFQSIVVAAVFSGRAWLPSTEKMRQEYANKVIEAGVGRPFHSLREKSVAYVEDVIGWVNAHAEVTGGPKYEPYSQEWIDEQKLFFQKYLANVQSRLVTPALTS